MASSLPPVRLRDLAALCGLSVSGVSRAMNGDPTMARATRDRVRAKAEEVGYAPNAAARSLREAGRRSDSQTFRGTLAYLVNPHEETQIRSRGGRDRYPWHFAVEERANRMGYAVDRFVLSEDESAGRIGRILGARGIRGVIFSANHQDPRACGLDWEKFAAVSLSASPSAHFLTNLSVPYFQDTFDAAQELVRRGYQRIGFLMIGNTLGPFLGGYEVALQRVSLPVFPALSQEAGIPRQLGSWLKRHRFDVVLTTSGMAVVEALEALGYRVPADLSVCVIDDIDRPGYLSGLRQPRLALARWAVDSIHNMLTHNEIGPPDEPVEIQFPSRWVEGKTLRPPKRSGRKK